jgi:hypothetical protein
VQLRNGRGTSLRPLLVAHSDSAFSGATSGKPGETTIVPSIKLPSFPVQISVVFDWLLLLRLSPQHADELFSFEILASATVAPRPD